MEGETKKNENMSAKSFPPKLGEYAYYDEKLHKQKRGHWIVNTTRHEDNLMGCHYSMKVPLSNKVPFVTCHGCITNIIREVKGPYHYLTLN
tara:strand:+ start:71 stop:343 length:273 start_codon:yes stop_codon:yes gene_type:complete